MSRLVAILSTWHLVSILCRDEKWPPHTPAQTTFGSDHFGYSRILAQTFYHMNNEWSMSSQQRMDKQEAASTKIEPSRNQQPTSYWKQWNQTLAEQCSALCQNRYAEALRLWLAFFWYETTGKFYSSKLANWLVWTCENKNWWGLGPHLPLKRTQQPPFTHSRQTVPEKKNTEFKKKRFCPHLRSSSIRAEVCSEVAGRCYKSSHPNHRKH